MRRTVALAGARSSFLAPRRRRMPRSWPRPCAICHGTEGRPVTKDVVPLAGLPREHIASQMRAFRDGQRPATVMHQIAKGYSDAQIDALAAWFAAQKRQAMKRRDFLKLAGAVSLAGCASATPSKARVVVIGGGFGGATAAKYIRMWDPSIDVVLVERDASFVSCPISNLVLGRVHRHGGHHAAATTACERYGVQVVRDEVTAVDAAKKTVQAGARRRHRLRAAGRLAGHRLHLRRSAGLRAGDAGRARAARLESRSADRGAAPAARSDARRRRLRPVDPARALPLPAGTVRAREHGRGLLQAGEAALQGAGARRQPGRHLQGAALQARLDGALPGHHRVPRQPRSGGRRRQGDDRAASSSRT